ncbi:MAG: 50S ribosomal protein L22 [Candidatus Babeliales bacterium]
MQFVAKTKFIRYSPYKLRPIADFVRGKNVKNALDWLYAHENQRVTPLKKMIESAVANAKYLKDIRSEDLYIKELRVDQGPTFKYFKPGAMGRATILRKRFSHLSVTLESKEQKEV